MDEQEEFIIQWCKEHHGFDALTCNFHYFFYEKFGGKRHDCLCSAQTVYKAMRLARRMYDKGILKRGRIGLANSWQPGLPKWVWVYYLPKPPKKTRPFK